MTGRNMGRANLHSIKFSYLFQPFVRVSGKMFRSLPPSKPSYSVYIYVNVCIGNILLPFSNVSFSSIISLYSFSLLFVFRFYSYWHIHPELSSIDSRDIFVKIGNSGESFFHSILCGNMEMLVICQNRKKNEKQLANFWLKTIWITSIFSDGFR